MIESDAVKLIVHMLAGRNNYAQNFAANTLRKMAKHGAISYCCIIFELTNFTDTLLAAMIEGESMKLIVNMIQSEDDYVQKAAQHALDRMAEHGAIGCPNILLI
jgi:hypothetical protein